MTLRIIVKTDRALPPGTVLVDYTTFDVELPEIEALLRAGGFNSEAHFEVSQVVGVSVLAKDNT